MGAALLLLTAGLVLAFVAAGVLRAPARPEPALLPALALYVLPSAVRLGLPLAVVAGLAAALGGWRERGVDVALAAAGVPGRALAGPVALLGLGVVGGVWALGHHIEPAALSHAGALTGGLRPVPGRVVVVEDLALSCEAAAGDALEGVVFAWQGKEDLLFGAASRGRWGPEALRLEDVRLSLPLPAPGPHAQAQRGPLLVEAQALTLRLPDRRVESIQKSDAALRDLAARMRARGRLPWAEEATLYKRDAWAAAAGLLVLLVPPLALGGRLGWLVAAPLLYWGAVRSVDQLGRALGGLGVAWAPTLLLAAGVVLAWGRWGRR